VGKTRLALAVASFLGRPIYRVDGDERYTESKLTGWFDPPIALAKGYGWDSFIVGPLTVAMMNGGVLFINELNRMPEGTQNVLLPAMDEGKIIIPRIGEVAAKPGFIVIATQNPEEFVGTSRISEALRDRFVWIGLRYQPFNEEVEIVRRETKVEKTSLLQMAVEIIRKTRVHPDLRRGASIRGAIDFVLFLKNAEEVTLKGLTECGIMALYNKIDVQLKSNRSKEDIIAEIVKSSVRNAAGDALEPLRLDDLRLDQEDERAPETRAGNARILIKRDATIYKSMSNLLKGEEMAGTVADNDKVDTRWILIEQYLSDDVEEGERVYIEGYVHRAIASLASEISEKGMRSCRRCIEYSNGPSPNENFDVEETLENLASKRFMDYGDIALINKIPRKLAVALIFDASNSMEGEKIVMAALAVAALAHKLENDHYSIVAFKNKAEVVKGFGEKLSIEEVVSKVLHYEYGGVTNIEDGLLKGLEQMEGCLAKEDYSERLGILVTDGWATTGGDPLEVAMQYPRLHVLQIGVGGGRIESTRLCEEVASVGHGVHTLIDDINELPYALMNILRCN